MQEFIQQHRHKTAQQLEKDLDFGVKSYFNKSDSLAKINVNVNQKKKRLKTINKNKMKFQDTFWDRI